MLRRFDMRMRCHLHLSNSTDVIPFGLPPGNSKSSCRHPQILHMFRVEDCRKEVGGFLPLPLSSRAFSARSGHCNNDISARNFIYHVMKIVVLLGLCSLLEDRVGPSGPKHHIDISTFRHPKSTMVQSQTSGLDLSNSPTARAMELLAFVMEGQPTHSQSQGRTSGIQGNTTLTGVKGLCCKWHTLHRTLCC